MIIDREKIRKSLFILSWFIDNIEEILKGKDKPHIECSWELISSLNEEGNTVDKK